MKTQYLIRFGIGIQLLFLVLWLFRAPGVASWLTITKAQLANGNPDGPGLELRGYDLTPSSWVYDSSRSAHENIVSRAALLLAAAQSDFRSLVKAPLILVALNLGMLVWLLILSQRSNQSASPNGGPAASSGNSNARGGLPSVS